MEPTDKKRLLVCVAWPYANGPLHLGHVAGSLLAPDIFARYHRMIGYEVLMVSGSDEHGTPITVHAEKLGVSPEELVRFYHKLNKECIEKAGIKFSLFTETHKENHIKVVQELFKRLYEKGYIYKRTMEAPYCPKCNRFLPDRYVEGTCPHCGYEESRGDQCDHCGKTLDPEELISPRCKICGGMPEFKETDHFFFKLSAFQRKLEEYVEKNKDHWRKNTYRYTMKWLREGLKDRPITRDLTWGVEIPIGHYPDKRIYVWFDAVTGYLACSIEYSRMIGHPDYWRKFWYDPKVKSYYFLGKDNVPFHTIIWPAMLMGYDENINLPYDVPSNEYLLLSGAQFSKSRRHAIWLHSYLQRYSADVMRFYLTWIMPENRDNDFRWENFVKANNNVLVATYGNLINRILTFTKKGFDGKVPPLQDEYMTRDDRDILAAIERYGKKIGQYIEKCEFKNAIRALFALAQEGNRYFDTKAPWKLIKEDKDKCGTVMNICLRLAKALAIYSLPFMPFSAQKLWRMLGYNDDIENHQWNEALSPVPTGQKLGDIHVLFNKLNLEEVLCAEKKASELVVEDEFLEYLKSKGKIKEEVEMAKEQIDLKEFSKIKLLVAEVEDVKNHPKADKLYILKLNLGSEGKRQIVAGLRDHYKPEELKGRKIVIVANLKPVKLRGELSEGMLLAAEDSDGNIAVLFTDETRNVSPGARIR